MPVGLTAMALAARIVPESRAPRPRRVDPVGLLLVIGAMSALTYAIIEGGRIGFEEPGIVVFIAIALGCFTVLVPYELHRREALVELRFLQALPLPAHALSQFACP